MARGLHGVPLVISDAHTGLKPPSPPPCWEPAGNAGSTSGAHPALGTAGTVPSEVRVVGGWPGRRSTATVPR
jgi:hypothetical protein